MYTPTLKQLIKNQIINLLMQKISHKLQSVADAIKLAAKIISGELAVCIQNGEFFLLPPQCKLALQMEKVYIYADYKLRRR